MRFFHGGLCYRWLSNHWRHFLSLCLRCRLDLDRRSWLLNQGRGCTRSHLSFLLPLWFRLISQLEWWRSKGGEVARTSSVRRLTGPADSDRPWVDASLPWSHRPRLLRFDTFRASTSSSSSSTGAAEYGQCGGIGWTGFTTWYVLSSCKVQFASVTYLLFISIPPYTCTVLNDYYSQCL